MMKSRYRSIVACVLMLGLAIPGAAIAGNAGKGCTLQGTWFGVVSPDDTTLTGWMVTVAGKSANEGTNNLEYPNFDPTFGGMFPTAARLSTLRGAWERTGGNTFAYTMIGIAVDEFNVPVWIGKLSGDTTLSSDCKSEFITATLEVFAPDQSPFDDVGFAVPLPDHYGYRAYVD